MTKKQKFEIVTADTAKNLSELVTGRLGKGWELVGQPFMVRALAHQSTKIGQAMKIYE